MGGLSTKPEVLNFIEIYGKDSIILTKIIHSSILDYTLFAVDKSGNIVDKCSVSKRILDWFPWSLIQTSRYTNQVTWKIKY